MKRPNGSFLTVASLGRCEDRRLCDRKRAFWPPFFWPRLSGFGRVFDRFSSGSIRVALMKAAFLAALRPHVLAACSLNASLSRPFLGKKKKRFLGQLSGFSVPFPPPPSLSLSHTNTRAHARTQAGGRRRSSRRRSRPWPPCGSSCTPSTCVRVTCVRPSHVCVRVTYVRVTCVRPSQSDRGRVRLCGSSCTPSTCARLCERLCVRVQRRTIHVRAFCMHLCGVRVRATCVCPSHLGVLESMPVPI